MRELKIKAPFAKAAEALSDVEFGRLIRGMLKYASSGEEPQLPGSERILWPTAKREVDDQLQAFTRRSVAGKKNVTKRYQPLPNATNGNDSYELVEQRKEDKWEEKEKEASSSPLKPPSNSKKELREGETEEKKQARARKPFVPPTLDEVRAYIEQRGSNVDPVQFWEYFNEGGWVDAKGQPVKNWKQKEITWEQFHGRGRRNGTERDPGRDQTGTGEVSPWGNLYSNKS